MDVAYCLDLLPYLFPHVGSDVLLTQLCTDHGELMVSKLCLKTCRAVGGCELSLDLILEWNVMVDIDRCWFEHWMLQVGMQLLRTALISCLLLTY